ncbi:MAG: threonine synthase [Tenericutes bacterium]|nr:threonine synthase [Mycoplasmatota bacterium]
MLKSTRGNKFIKPSLAILKGLADDGGLFVFDAFNKDFFRKEFIDLTYQELALKVFKEFLSDYTENQLISVIDKSYNASKFQGNIVDVLAVGDNFYLNLFNGNTFAFKDLALSCLPNLMSEAKLINNVTKDTIILTATSGDTGSATLEGFKDQADVSVIVLYPTNGVSEFQELQMNQYVSDKNIVVPVIGNFDDCQRIVKEIFLSVKPKNVTLSSANSINIGRILPQTIYYFYAYFDLVRQAKIQYGEPLNVCVPTGNFGNIYSAYIAKSMGLPIDKLIVASNSNKVLSELFNEGKYRIARELHKTISPSMDIIISSNFERYLFDLLSKDSKVVKEKMEQLKNDSCIEINEIFDNESIKAYYASEAETYETIKTVYEEDNYLIDPHTAVAKCVANKYREESKDFKAMLVVSTASPYKFSDAVIKALDLNCLGGLTNKLNCLEKATNYAIDQRMNQVLTHTVEKEAVSTTNASKLIRKIIGKLDA